MTPVAEMTLRALGATLAESRRPEVRAMASFVDAVLTAEGLPVGLPQPAPERSRKAINQAAYRERRREAVTVPATSQVTEPVTSAGNVAGNTGGVGGGSLLSSPGISSTSQKERERGAGNVTGQRDRGSVTALVSLSDPLPDELRAAADVIGVQDVAGAWLKFVGHHDGQHLRSLPGAWQTWCGKEAAFEKTARSRGRARADVQPVPAAGRAWKVGV